MKQVYFIIFLVLSLLSCKKKEESIINSIYRGKAVQEIKMYSFNLNTGVKDSSVTTNTEDIRMYATKDSFCLLRSDGTKACAGKLSTRDTYITFESQACDCWCDCAPNIDCGGDPILGKHELINFNNQELVFQTIHTNYGNFFKKVFTLKKE